jgi:hypothetical protein
MALSGLPRFSAASLFRKAKYTVQRVACDVS